MGWTLLGIILKITGNLKCCDPGVKWEGSKGWPAFNVDFHSVIRKSNSSSEGNAIMGIFFFFSLVIHNFMS